MSLHLHWKRSPPRSEHSVKPELEALKQEAEVARQRVAAALERIQRALDKDLELSCDDCGSCVDPRSIPLYVNGKNGTHK